MGESDRQPGLVVVVVDVDAAVAVVLSLMLAW